MKQIYQDLWQTKLEMPFGGVHAHAYFLQCSEGNVLIYNTGHTEEINHITEMGEPGYRVRADPTAQNAKEEKDPYDSNQQKTEIVV